MELITRIYQFLTNPFPLWETTLTNQLVQHQWKELSSKGSINYENYSTAGVWFNKPPLEIDEKIQVPKSCINAEMPSYLLNTFYEDHGLELLSKDEIEVSEALLKVNKALSVLRLIEPAYTCICDLVRSIHILRQPDEEIDLSYSHPKIPFSIFFSVCDDNSVISNLRVAESILHEAMHLKLTLIENVTPLVKPGTKALFYSPWRDEERPIKGVLHGLFVFKSIYQFYQKILNKYEGEESDFISFRLKNIKQEFSTITGFNNLKDLLDTGQCLTAKILENP